MSIYGDYSSSYDGVGWEEENCMLGKVEAMDNVSLVFEV